MAVGFRKKFTVAREQSAATPGLHLRYYVAIARPDHWVKNVFMLLGTAAAFVIHPRLFSWAALPSLSLGLAATCLIASSNYVLNEILDADLDRHHPEKELPAAGRRPHFGAHRLSGVDLAGMRRHGSGLEGKPPLLHVGRLALGDGNHLQRSADSNQGNADR